MPDAALLSLLGLGALHGLNPAMGWLFAVAIGLRERSRRALGEALLPIAVGHEASVAVAVLAIELWGSAVGQRAVGLAGAALLVGFGAYKLVARRAHPRWVGAHLTRRELAWWSFLMSSAHGAGLMLLPVVDGGPALAGSHGGAGLDAGAAAVASLDAVLAGGVHTAAMLVVMGAVAVAVYELVGVRFLRRGWLNVDRAWAVALVVAGAVTLFS